MRRYETIIISDPELDEEVRTGLFEKLRAIMDGHGGFIVLEDDWGVIKMAYEVRKRTRGHYLRLEYCGDAALVTELERQMRIDDKILKYLTVLLEKQVDLEAVKAAKEAEAQQESADADQSPDESPSTPSDPETEPDVQAESQTATEPSPATDPVESVTDTISEKE